MLILCSFVIFDIQYRKRKIVFDLKMHFDG